MSKVLLTGGTGYIASHTAVELISDGYDVVLVDNLSNSRPDVVDRIERITNVRPVFYEADISEYNSLLKIFEDEAPDSVIHFAAHKAVGESVEKPLKYYDNNLTSAITLLRVMSCCGVKQIVFSSSATLYSLSDKIPFKEDTYPLGCTNPYGWTKFMIEQILSDTAKADPEMSVVSLRYFNPIGAHETGLIGERPADIPSNIMPYITQVAIGILPELRVFGNDYPTPDGTGVRDYIHIVDLAKGHVAAMKYCKENVGYDVFNLGAGHGYSVMEVVNTFERVNGVSVPYTIVDRRAGDIAICYADTSKAERVLDWKAEKSLEDMCIDAWRWQKAQMEETR